MWFLPMLLPDWASLHSLVNALPYAAGPDFCVAWKAWSFVLPELMSSCMSSPRMPSLEIEEHVHSEGSSSSMDDLIFRQIVDLPEPATPKGMMRRMLRT